MVKYKYFLATFIIMLMPLVGSCAKGEADKSDKQGMRTHGTHSGEAATDAGLVAFIKKQKLSNFQSTTIGNAFDSYRYVTKKEWKSTSLTSGQITIDFTGWFEPASLSDNDRKAGVTGRGVDVTFLVEPNGSFYVFLVSKIESNAEGKVRRVQSVDSAGILEQIYSNKMISF